MGNAMFYFTPEPNGSHLVKLDMGEALGEMYSDILTEAVDGISLSGSISRSVGRTQEVVTIQRDRMLLGEDLAYRFHALQNHLDRGFSCSFSSDSDKAYCFPVRGTTNAGTKTIQCYGNPFVNQVGTTSTPSIDDYMTIETSSPAMIQEMVKVKTNGAISSSGGSFTIDKNLCFQYDEPAYIRHYRFYPVLKRPQSDIGQSIITNEGGRLFSLSIRLVVDYRTLFAFHPDFLAESGIQIGSGLVREAPASGEVPSGYTGGGIDGVPERAKIGNFELGSQTIPPQVILGS